MGTILRAIIAYLFLLLALRVIGRRAVAQITPFELILVFLIGGTMVQSIVTDNRSFTNAVLAVMTISGMHVGVGSLKRRSEAIRKIVDGTPLMLRENGQWRENLMSQAQILEEDVMAAARSAGIFHLAQVRHAILERNGDITIIRDGP